MGQPLRAGSFAELAWEPREPFGHLGGGDEWEAFLSLDGGAHYTVRITPHLDRGLRRVLWQVPAAPTADARLLLRFGDERREVAFELPQRFVIAGPAAAGPALLPARRDIRRGEPALSGQEGVVVWAEGTRRGGSARTVTGGEPPSAQSREALAGDTDETALLADTRGPELDPAAETVPAGWVTPSRQRLASFSLPGHGPAAPIPILLQSRRRNE